MPGWCGARGAAGLGRQELGLPAAGRAGRRRAAGLLRRRRAAGAGCDRGGGARAGRPTCRRLLGVPAPAHRRPGRGFADAADRRRAAVLPAVRPAVGGRAVRGYRERVAAGDAAELPAPRWPGSPRCAAEIVEDVALARKARRAGLKLGLALGGELVQTRMYAGYRAGRGRAGPGVARGGRRLPAGGWRPLPAGTWRPTPCRWSPRPGSGAGCCRSGWGCSNGCWSG